jgi:hypothetical protein
MLVGKLRVCSPLEAHAYRFGGAGVQLSAPRRLTLHGISQQVRRASLTNRVTLADPGR